jgi:hypothetical protein
VLPGQIFQAVLFVSQAESTAYSKVSQATMKLLNTYEDRDEAEAAADKLTGENV